MPESLPAEVAASRDAAAGFVKEVIESRGESLLPGEPVPGSLLAEVRSASQAAGFYYKTQPKEFGGNPASALELTMLRELFAAANTPLTAAIFGPGPGVLHAVEGELKTTYLEPLLRGEKRGAFAFTEPDGAERPSWAQIDGDNLVINGQKSYITGGREADFISALLNVEDADGAKAGTAMVVIDTGTKGVNIDREFESMDGSGHVSMQFNDVRQPMSHIIGKLGEGMPRALGNIGNVRMMVSAQAIGISMWVIDYIEKHLLAPHRSGTPLGEREGVRMRFADMRIEVFVARSALYRTARIVDSGENSVNETVAAKVFCTETAGRVVDMGLQLVGGQALVRGHPLEQLYRQVRAFRFVEGASDLLRLNLAKGKLELGKGRL
jgi:acyl-CoA dehydrogenase